MRASWPPGTRVSVGAESAEHALTLEILRRGFASFGYQPVQLPVLDYADTFLHRSGEEIRRRMYIFRDPGSAEVCLRPELTIAACRAFIAEHGHTRRESRRSYVGPVFRYDKPRQGRLREFTQAGVELFGAADKLAADAEILALALQSVRDLGLTDTQVFTGDLAVVREVIGATPLEAGTRERFLSMLWRRRALEHFLGSLPRGADAPERPATVALDDTSRAITRELITRLFPQRVGSRTVEEIADRILERLFLTSTPRLPADVVDVIQRFTAISDAAPSALAAIELVYKDLGVEHSPALESLRARLERFEAHGIDTRTLTLDMSFRRGIEYYTSFVFEVHAPALGPVSQVVGGGRYDNLMTSLGGGDVPAAGFAIGVERAMLARPAGSDARAGSAVPDALVVSAGAVPHRTVVSVATVLRQAGMRVAIDASRSSLRSALGRASTEGIPRVVIVGEDELRADTVRVRDMRDRSETAVAVAALPAFGRAIASGRPAGA